MKDFKINQEKTDFLIDVLKNNKDLEPDFFRSILPFEPFVIVDKVIDNITNYRALPSENKILIPVAIYFNNCRTNYSTIDDCKAFANVYGIENIYVGMFDIEEII